VVEYITSISKIKKTQTGRFPKMTRETYPPGLLSLRCSMSKNNIPEPLGLTQNEWTLYLA